jgi:nucleolar MIF4G domain-containing protein 1
MRGGSAPKSILKRKEEKVESESESAEEEFDDDILNEDYDEELEDPSDEEDEGEEEEEEEERPRQSKSSRSLQDILAEDDAEIAALEKALGIKGKKKLPKAFTEDGLDEILGDLADDSEAEDKKRKREGDEWLQRKRRKAAAEQRGHPMSEEDESDISGPDGLSDSGESEGTDGSAGFDGFDDEDQDQDEDEDEDTPRQTTKTRENPYIAPVAGTTAKKYIPPSLRTTSHEESESLSRLRRLVQGHLNKLSEANLISILSEIEQLYQTYPRQNVTSTLLDLLLGLICDPSILSEAFINLHAGFIAAIYKVMGMDFGAA